MIHIHPKVKEALAKNQPVVALESTIISHGMPYPENVKTAMEVERVIEENGAIAATIGIIDGVAVIGMTPQQIEAFGSRGYIAKVSRRDLPVIFARKEWGATTVATTMILAAKAGIEVFVTGGIGGVHRGAQSSFDISADLQELANTDVTVVCAGAKAILDLPLTLEYLETFGVPVLGYQSDQLAAFYSRESGLKVDANMKDCDQIADVVLAKRNFGLRGGVLISNPIPKEYDMDPIVINQAIATALAQMNEQGVKGNEVTPFLLAKVKELTGGDSLESNIALIKNNAVVGAQIAMSLCVKKGERHV
ncbi:MAG TPA: pseudouridine-5-phosphate glycosidase [Erysipelotrichaceae bacterium]|nr:pseudouridine-5-phosphate glycosidase [Erysipelotrichaceae bacterium]